MPFAAEEILSCMDGLMTRFLHSMCMPRIVYAASPMTCTVTPFMEDASYGSGTDIFAIYAIVGNPEYVNNSGTRP